MGEGGGLLIAALLLPSSSVLMSYVLHASLSLKATLSSKSVRSWQGHAGPPRLQLTDDTSIPAGVSFCLTCFSKYKSDESGLQRRMFQL